MDDQADTLDQADEEILTHTVADEALEAAAGTDGSGGCLSMGIVCTFSFGC